MQIEPIRNGSVTAPRGFLAGAVCAGMYAGGPKAGALDLALLVSERECTTAGVFTTNLVKGAPVLVSQQRLGGGRMRAVVANSGNSNSLNGPGGYRDATEMTELAAAHLGLDPQAVAVSSTGVTGVAMPMEKIRAAIPRISVDRDGGSDFARAIMTTDTLPKECAFSVRDDVYHIAGCAKGSGMIHPNLATMLAYVTTDAAVERGLLQRLTSEVADETLNMLSIDGDTSCSDTLLVFANGAAGPPIEAGSPRADAFRDALHAVCLQLTRMLARDGEGARRLIEVEVRGAVSLADARLIARTITTSPLVKTAVAGADPNWGRILVAAGRAGAPLEESRTSMRLQGELLLDHGAAQPFDEETLHRKLDVDEVRIQLDLDLGDASARAWGCDLTADYVHVNADYRT